jgi:hypothetical protein
MMKVKSMPRFLTALACLALLFAIPTTSWEASTSANLAITVSSGGTSGGAGGGPNAALFAAPYYTCSTNRYLATNGSDSNDGTTRTTGGGHGPWLTLANANYLSQGTCINIQAGTYTVNAQSVSLASGQGASLPGGYLVIRSDGSFGGGSTAVDGAIFKAPTTVDYNAMIGLGSNYIIIDGLELDGSHPDDGGNTIGLQGPGIMTFTHEHVKILNSKIHNLGPVVLPTLEVVLGAAISLKGL